MAVVLKNIGKIAVSAVLGETAEEEKQIRERIPSVYRYCMGRVGSMEANRIFAAVETAANRQGILDGSYRAEHALYHASLEAFQGVCRGQVVLGEVLRTVGLRFSIIVGPRYYKDSDENWLAIAMYGTIGAPIKGFEHETLGLGINHF